MNFWEKMKGKEGPILCLAPMADVTDTAFRHIIAKYSKITPHQKSQGKPLTYVTYTEFVSADGLVLAPEIGRRKLLKDLEYSEIERPIVAQLFGSNPENIEKAAGFIAELGPALYHPSGTRIGSGFDGIDINMGCPDKSIEKQEAGAALIKNPHLARSLIRAAKLGAKNTIPVSVKTRLGYNKDELEKWLPELLAENPAAIIIHARTRKEMSKVPARWERIKRAVEIRDEIQSKTLIIGNGDAKNIADAVKKCEESRADGAMLGRAVFGNPWLFADYKPTLKERLKVLVEHTKLFEEKFREMKNFAIMKKHYKAYLNSIPEVKELKINLMRAKNADEVEAVVNNFLILYN